MGERSGFLASAHLMRHFKVKSDPTDLKEVSQQHLNLPTVVISGKSRDPLYIGHTPKYITLQLILWRSLLDSGILPPPDAWCWFSVGKWTVLVHSLTVLVKAEYFVSG